MQGPVCFVDPPISASALPDTLFADCMVIRNVIFRVDEIIFREADAGKLLACVLEHGCFYGLAEMFAPHPAAHAVTPYSKQWRISTGDFALIPAHELDQVGLLLKENSATCANRISVHSPHPLQL